MEQSLPLLTVGVSPTIGLVATRLKDAVTVNKEAVHHGNLPRWYFPIPTFFLKPLKLRILNRAASPSYTSHLLPLWTLPKAMQATKFAGWAVSEFTVCLYL
jgi:hypothetical protein